MGNMSTSIPSLLTPAQVKAVAQVWTSTPLVGLPAGGFGKKPDSFEDVIVMMLQMSDALGQAIRERDEALMDQRDMEHEIAMSGKLLRRMLGTEQ